MKQLFSRDIQKLLGLMFFLIGFPFLKIGVSFSFFIFIFILIKLKFNYRNFRIIKLVDFTDYSIVLFLFWSFFSSLTTPNDVKNSNLSFDFLLNSQLVYWCVLFLFIKNNFERIDFKLIGKYIFISSFLLIFFFYFFQFKMNLLFVEISSVKARNAFVYQIETILPLVLFYIENFARFRKLLIFVFYLVSALMSNGRAGTIILSINFLFFLIVTKFINKYIFIGLVLFLFIQNEFKIVDSEKILSAIGESIKPYNPRIANLLVQEEDGDLDFDKSWIERQIHISKGLEIFEKFPIKGVGFGNFSEFTSDYANIDLKDYVVNGSVRITEKSLQSFNNRSSHNSYIQILAEFGLIGLILYFCVLLKLVLGSVNYIFFNYLSFKFLDLILICTLSILLHNWVVSAFVGANTFAILGMSYGYLKSKKL